MNKEKCEDCDKLLDDGIRYKNRYYCNMCMKKIETYKNKIIDEILKKNRIDFSNINLKNNFEKRKYLNEYSVGELRDFLIEEE